MNYLEIASTLYQIPKFPYTKKDRRGIYEHLFSLGCYRKSEIQSRASAQPRKTALLCTRILSFKFMLPRITTGEQPQQNKTDSESLEMTSAIVCGAGKSAVQSRRHENLRIWEAAAPPGSPKSRTSDFAGMGNGDGAPGPDPAPAPLARLGGPGPQEG